MTKVRLDINIHERKRRSYPGRKLPGWNGGGALAHQVSREFGGPMST
jgi:hypothetical protein